MTLPNDRQDTPQNFVGNEKEESITDPIAIEKRFQLNIAKRTVEGDYCASVVSKVEKPVIIVAPDLKSLLKEIVSNVRRQDKLTTNFPLVREEPRIILNGHAE